MLFKFGGFSDKRLVEAIQKGPPGEAYEEALIQLYDQFESKSIKYLLKNHQVSQDEAQEIIRESLVDLIDNIQLSKYEGRGSLYGYFMGILKNRAKIWINKRPNSEPPDSADDESQSPENQFLAKEKWQMVERVLAQLKNPKCREILLWGKEDSSDDLAKRLGYDDANVLYVTRSRCKEALKAILKKEEIIQWIKA